MDGRETRQRSAIRKIVPSHAASRNIPDDSESIAITYEMRLWPARILEAKKKKKNHERPKAPGKRAKTIRGTKKSPRDVISTPTRELYRLGNCVTTVNSTPAHFSLSSPSPLCLSAAYLLRSFAAAFQAIRNVKKAEHARR